MQIIEMKEVSLTEGNIRVVIEAFNCDHPEIFWISNILAIIQMKMLQWFICILNLAEKK